MLKKLLYVTVFFPLLSILVVVNMFVLHSYTSKQKLAKATEYILSPLADAGAIHLSASENTSKVLGASVVAADARGKLLHDFLQSHQSPLTPFANLIVEEADKNGIDFRLVVSIAMCESNLGKRIPADSYNAWGIAVYTGQKSGAAFDGWDHAIVWVSRYMKERYLNRGLDTLREIGAVYAPPSVLTGHSWSNCVESFQQSIF